LEIEICGVQTQPAVKNHPTNVNIDLYIYGQLILSVFEIFPVISNFAVRRSPLQISALRSSAVTESCVAVVDRYREMMKTGDGITAIFHILRSSRFVSHSTLQKPSELQEAPEINLRIKG
jgi:hypothetical protein